MCGRVQMLEKGTPYCFFLLEKKHLIFDIFAKTETSTVMNQSEAAFQGCTPECVLQKQPPEVFYK